MTGDLLVREAALRHDELQARGALAQAMLQALQIRNDLATTREQLNRLLGRDVRSPLRVAEVPPRTLAELDLEAARERALRERPEVRQAHDLVEKAEADRGLKALDYVPDVSLFVSYSSHFNVDVLPRHVALAGVQLKWDGLDWGRRGQELEEKSLAVKEAQVRARDAEQAVLVDVGDRFRKLQEARATLASAELSLEALRARVPVVEARLAREAALARDALDARAQLARAAHDREQAVLSLWSAAADFQKALGEAP